VHSLGVTERIKNNVALLFAVAAVITIVFIIIFAASNSAQGAKAPQSRQNYYG